LFLRIGHFQSYFQVHTEVVII